MTVQVPSARINRGMRVSRRSCPSQSRPRTGDILLVEVEWQREWNIPLGELSEMLTWGGEAREASEVGNGG